MVQRNTGRVQKAKHFTIVKSSIGSFFYAIIEMEDLLMIKRIIDRNLERMAKEILTVDDKEIKYFLRETAKEGVNSTGQIDFMKTILSQVIIADKEDYQEALYEQMESFLNTLKMHSESYLFHVEMKSPAIHSTRDFRLPAYHSVADLCYAVIAAYEGLGSHLFVLNYKKDRFSLSDDDESFPAEMIPLGNLEMRKGSTLKLIYDYGENWEFIIKYEGKKKVDYIANVPELIQGEGYNLWDDERYLLEKLVINPDEVVEDFEGQPITVQECADGGHITLFREDQKENFSDDFLELKESYEYRIMDDLVENLMNDFDGEHQA